MAEKDKAKEKREAVKEKKKAGENGGRSRVMKPMFGIRIRLR